MALFTISRNTVQSSVHAQVSKNVCRLHDNATDSKTNWGVLTSPNIQAFVHFIFHVHISELIGHLCMNTTLDGVPRYDKQIHLTFSRSFFDALCEWVMRSMSREADSSDLGTCFGFLVN